MEKLMVFTCCHINEATLVSLVFQNLVVWIEKFLRIKFITLPLMYSACTQYLDAPPTDAKQEEKSVLEQTVLSTKYKTVL